MKPILIRLTKPNKKYTKFMNKHIHDKPPLGVYVLKNTRNLGHILLLDDDQHAGEETKIPGYWIGNVIIYKKYRHLGFEKYC